MRSVMPTNPQAEDIIRVARLREMIVANITQSGEYNLNRVALERQRKLPPIETGAIVLLSAEKPRKLHSASVGMYVHLELVRSPL